MATDEEVRPDPDALLERVKAEEARSARARFKIFFGYAAGVGKTYTMLEAARRERAEGTDVVVGLVETHGRAETAALLEGLEVLPRRQVDYRGARLAELDLDAVLARRPAVILVDELAHTNAPGSRHPKRWQDVLELLEAGIEVHTTLNVQHVESLNDVVAQISWVQVRETVPDAVLERADEIELVDLTPDELLERLREGKVYVPDQASRAVERFFKRGNLLALRELALRRTAEQVDVEVRAYRREQGITTTWPAAERILVCVGPSPSSARLIRAARRMAAGLRAPWVAASAEAPGAYPLTPEDRERLQSHLRLAESLGAEVVRLAGKRISTEVLRYAREHNVTRIVLGKPTHRRWRDLLRVRGSLVDEVVRGSGEIEVHFVSTVAGEGRQPRDRAKAVTAPIAWSAHLQAAGLVSAITIAAVAARGYLSAPDVVTLYLLVIMVAAFRLGRRPTLVAAALSVAAYDFCFVPPFYTFTVEHARHLLTFAMMFGVGFVVSSLVTRLQQQERDARIREERTATLYALSRELVAVLDAAETARIAAGHAAVVFGGDAAVLLRLETGSLTLSATSRAELRLDDEELAVARWAIDHGRPTGVGTDTLPGSGVLCIPLQVGSNPLGVLALTPGAHVRDPEHDSFLDAFVRQISLALGRAWAAEEAKAAARKVHREEIRSALLSAVSHDLRTPLASITGAGTALRDDSALLSPEQHVELVETICVEAERMERLVGNVLDMVRIESGGLSPRREWVPLEELVGSALDRLSARLRGRDVKLDLPPDLPFLCVDPVLFVQVFVNLIDNALKYAPGDSPIEIAARAVDGRVEIDVADRGPGIRPGEEERVFEKFFRGDRAGTGGVGLGLPICRGIVAAHGGTIAVRPREGGGVVFRIRLPQNETPPEVHVDEEVAP
jgi:two-component system sensor histidine kinase KdpD